MRKLTLEERVIRLEKLLLEDAFDDELDAMADDIVEKYPPLDLYKELGDVALDIMKKMPQADIDKELDDAALDIVNKDVRFSYDTVEDYLDSVVFYNLNKDYPSYVVINALQALLDDIEAFNSFKSMRVIKFMKKQIREINDLSYFKAKKIVVNAIKEVLDYEKEELKNQLEQFKKFINSCTRNIRKEINTCTNCKLWDIEVPQFNSNKPIAFITINRREPFVSRKDWTNYVIYEFVKNGKTVYNYKTDVSKQSNLSKDELLKEITDDACAHINSMENL
jgi:hypothetical protein